MAVGQYDSRDVVGRNILGCKVLEQISCARCQAVCSRVYKDAMLPARQHQTCAANRFGPGQERDAEAPREVDVLRGTIQLDA